MTSVHELSYSTVYRDQYVLLFLLLLEPPCVQGGQLLYKANIHDVSEVTECILIFAIHACMSDACMHV